MRITRMLIVAIMAACFATLAGSTEHDVDPAWYRALNMSAPVNPHFEPFEIVGIGSEPGNHLVAKFYYCNYKQGDKSPPAVSIRGSKKSDGTFWPHVTAQVSNNANGPWT